jgi:hypothetical protein
MKTYVVALAVLVAILGGFYAGYKVGHSSVSASSSTQSPRTAAATPGGFGGGRGLAAVCPTPGTTSTAGTQAIARGTITNLNSTSMTVTSTACDVKVTFGATVTIDKQVSGSTSDLQDNLTVTITGTRQADGSILAQTITIGGAGGGTTRGGSGSGNGG